MDRENHQQGTGAISGDVPPKGIRPLSLRQLWQSHRQLLIFLVAVACFGVGSPFFETTFNNYLSDTFNMGHEARGNLEFPREMPGFLVAVSAGVLFFMAETRIAALAAVIAALGMVGLGVFGERYWAMMVFMIMWSAGTHLSMPVQSSISLSLSRRSQEGRRLGQIGVVSGVASIAGAVGVSLLLRTLGLSYRAAFFAGAAAFALAGAVLMLMHPTVGSQRRPKLTVHRRYGLYYVLCILFGARKQIFLTFGPWVLIKVYSQPVWVFAELWMVSSALGIFFRPFVGHLIDTLGERTVLMADAVFLALVCAGYGFGDHLGLGDKTIYLLYACYVGDQLLFAVGMARTTYLKKIAVSPQHVASSLALGITLDHATSMSVPSAGGKLWSAFGEATGYRQVFMAATGIALLNFVLSSLIRIPKEAELEEPALPPPVTGGVGDKG
jgi:nitrate/nitrite transporter NarK